MAVVFEGARAVVRPTLAGAVLLLRIQELNQNDYSRLFRRSGEVQKTPEHNVMIWVRSDEVNRAGVHRGMAVFAMRDASIWARWQIQLAGSDRSAGGSTFERADFVC
jgi:hypothetical protein